MGQFRTYTSEAGATGVPQGQSASGTANTFGAATGNALGQVGGQMRQTAFDIKEIQVKEDVLKAHKEAALIRGKAELQLDEWRKEGKPVGDRMSEWLENEVSLYQGERTTNQGRALAEQTAILLANDVSQVARAFDADLAGKEAADTVAVVQQANGVRLQTTPDIFPLIVDENRTLVDALTIPEQLKPAVLRQLNADAAKQAVVGEAAVSPQTTLDKVKSGAFDSYLDPDQRTTLIDRLEMDISREAGIQKAQADEAKRLRDQTVMADMNVAVVKAHASDPLQRLTKADVDAMALAADGYGPLHSKTDIMQLYNLIETQAANGPTKTDPNTLINLIPALAAGAGPEVVQEAFKNGLLSAEDYKTLYASATEGPPALQSVRRNALGNISSAMGLMPGLEGLYPNYEVAATQMMQQAMEREAAYAKAGKNRLEYYTGGEFVKDAKAIGSRFSLIQAQDAVSTVMQNVKPNEPFALGGATVKWNGIEPIDARDSAGNYINLELAQ